MDVVVSEIKPSASAQYNVIHLQMSCYVAVIAFVTLLKLNWFDLLLRSRDRCEGGLYCDEHVCLSVCLSVWLA